MPPLTPTTVDFMAAAKSRLRQRNLAARNPVAQEVSFQLPEDFDVIVSLDDADKKPFYQCLAPKMTLLSFMTQTISFTLEVTGANGVEKQVRIIGYRDLIAAASCAQLGSKPHTQSEQWVSYARDVFYTAYGLLLGSPNTDRPYGHQEDPSGSGIILTREWLPGHLVSAVRFFDYPMQCAAHHLGKALREFNHSPDVRVHPLAVVSGQDYQQDLEKFEEESLFLPMSHVYLHDAGHAKTAPDEGTWFPVW